MQRMLKVLEAPTYFHGDCVADMVVINLLQVPQYLRTSPFFLSLNVPDDQLDQFSFDIPDRCLMPNPENIRDRSDLDHFLRTICFWDNLELVGISPVFLDYVFHPSNKKQCLKAFPPYLVDIPDLETITAVLRAPKSGRLKLAAELGSLMLLHFLSKETPDQCAEFDAVRAAQRSGHMDCLEYLIQWSRNQHDLCEFVARKGDASLLSTLIAVGLRPTTETANTAASNGEDACLQRLILGDCPVDAEAAATAAAKKGHIQCLQLLFQYGKTLWRDDIDFFAFMRFSIRTRKDLNCLKYIHSIGYECTAKTFINCVAGNRIDCAVWLVLNIRNLSIDPCNIAAHHGNVKILKALRSAGCDFASNICTVAATAGKVDVLIYLYGEGIEAETDAITSAAENGHFSCLEFLHENGCPWDESTALAAGRRGRHYLRYVLDGGCPCMRTVFNTNAIASNCDMNTLIFLHEMEFPWNESTLFAIFTGEGYGKFSRLMYALENECSCDSSVCNVAVAKGDMKDLTILLEMGFPLDDSAFLAAVRGGHLHMLQFIKERGYFWGQSCFDAAVTGGHLPCVEYMMEHNCPMNVMNAIDIAAQNGHIDVIKYLRERRFPWTSNTCAVAAGFGQLEVLKFLHANKCPWDEETCKRATPECLDFAVSNGCPGG